MFRTVAHLCYWCVIMVTRCHSTFVQTHGIDNSKSDPSVHCGLGGMTMVSVGTSAVTNGPSDLG